MSTPIETAAEAIQAGEFSRKETLRTWEQTNERTREMYRDEARDALASLAEHRENIGREVHRAWCCTELYGVPDGHDLSDEDRAVTDAVLAYLTGEAS